MRLPTFILTFHHIHIGQLVPRAITLFLLLAVMIGIIVGIRYYKYQQTTQASLSGKLFQIQKEFTALKNVDQYKRNNELQATISAMQKAFSQTVDEYKNLVDLRQNIKDMTVYDTLFAQLLEELSQKNYASASSDLTSLAANIASEEQKLAAAAAPAAPSIGNAPANNNPPGSGYSRQSVATDRGNFVVDIIAADMGSTKIIIDTASSGDCNNNCPTLPLSDYVARNGAYAGINGTFFCPTEYPQCAGKTNSFDLLVMNKNKTYFNSANNVYSTNPVVIFGNGFIRFIGATSGWGRDTSIDGVISNFPLLISGGNIVFGDSNDTKFTNKGTRDFVANRGNTAYIGVMYNANMTDAAHVLKAMNMDNAMNLDEGGSTAFMQNGSYIAGPGRNIPNAILLLHR